MVLIIRSAQVAVFEAAATERFKAALTLHLERALTRADIRHEAKALRSEIDQGVAQCRGFGLENQSDVARLFEVVCLAGHSFVTGLPAEALGILSDHRVDPALKLHRLSVWAGASGTGAIVRRAEPGGEARA